MNQKVLSVLVRLLHAIFQRKRGIWARDPRLSRHFWSHKRTWHWVVRHSSEFVWVCCLRWFSWFQKCDTRRWISDSLYIPLHGYEFIWTFHLSDFGKFGRAQAVGGRGASHGGWHRFSQRDIFPERAFCAVWCAFARYARRRPSNDRSGRFIHIGESRVGEVRNRNAIFSLHVLVFDSIWFQS